MKKEIAFILITAIGLTLGSCWSRSELNELAIVTAVGLDKIENDDELLVSLQIIKPSEIKSTSDGGGSGSKGVWIAQNKGYTIFDAIRNATMITERKVFLSQLKAIVIGEELAKTGIGPILDVFDRDPEPRRTAWLLIAKGRAEDVIKAEHEQEKIPSQALEGLIESSIFSSKAVKVNLHEFLKMLSADTTDPYAIRVETFEDEAEDGENKKSKTVNRIRLTGAAVFKKDKLIGWLNRPEARGLNWINGKVSSGIIVVKSPIDERKNVALEIIRASSKIDPEIRDGEIIINVNIKEEGNLGEQMSKDSLSKPEMYDSLEQRKAIVIKNEIEAVIKKAQDEWNVDIFGFGEAVHRKYPKEWKSLKYRWREVFPHIQVNVKVSAELRTNDLSNYPPIP